LRKITSARAYPRLPISPARPTVHSFTFGDFNPRGSRMLSTPGTEGGVRNGRRFVPPLAKNQSKIILRACSGGTRELGAELRFVLIPGRGWFTWNDALGPAGSPLFPAPSDKRPTYCPQLTIAVRRPLAKMS